MTVPASLSKWAHPPRSNTPRSSSSGPPGPCITPSTETCVVVVSFMASSLLSLRAACRRRADWRSRLRVWFTCARGCASSRRDRREGDVSERARSAIEREPAQLVAQPLVVEHELPDLVGQLVALPLALPATSVVARAFGRRRPDGPDRVGRSTQFVGRHVAHRGGLTGGVRRF